MSLPAPSAAPWPARAGEERGSAREGRDPWLLTAAFLAVAGLALAFHEPWRDEIQAWLLARDSASPLELFRNLKTEGHPGLWHLLLTPIARAGAGPAGMQVAALAIGAATVWVVARFAPFTRTQKLLFAFGYFPLYEYTVLARAYGLGVLLIAIACALYRVRYRHPVALAAVLFLASHTSAHAMLVAAGLGAAFVIDLAIAAARGTGARDPTRERGERRDGGAPAPGWRRTALASAVGAIVLLGALTAYWQLSPPGSGLLPDWRFAWDERSVRKLVRLFARPFVPLSVPGPDYWDTTVLDAVRGAYRWKLLAGGGLLAATIALVLPRRNAAVAYLVGLALLLHVFYGVHHGGLRHHGFLFVAFLAACWIAADERATAARLDRVRAVFLTLLLAVHAAGGVLAVVGEVRWEFSAARRTAAFLRSEGLADATFVAEPDWLAAPILGFLPARRAFFPRAERWGSFVRWDAARLAGPTDAEVVAHVERLRRERGGPMVLLVDHALVRSLEESAGLRPLGTFRGDVVPEERFVVYAAP